MAQVITTRANDVAPNPASEKVGPLEYGFWAFLLVAVARVGELIPGLRSFPIEKLILGVTFLFLVAEWKRLPGITAPARPLARTAAWLAVLSILLTPISVWIGASFSFVVRELPDLIVSTAIAYMMSRSWRAVRGTMLTLVMSGVILAGVALASYTGGRAATPTMYDSNDLAYLLVTVLPLAVGFAVTANNLPIRLLHAGIASLLAIASLLTESRGGFLALLGIAGLMIFMPIKPVAADERRYGIKILSLFAAIVLGLIVWSHLPEQTRARLSTIMSLGQDYNLDPDERMGRSQVWRRGFDAALSRPWGSGPRSFNMVDLRHGGDFQASHNSFLEVLVELGVVGVLLFVRLYVLAWRGLKRSRRMLLAEGERSKDKEEQAVFARMLQMALVGNVIAGFFLSMAYSSTLWVLVGTCMAVISLAHRDAADGRHRGASRPARESAGG